MIPEGHAIELLAPARDLECGRTAVDCGADALYIGAPRFGARSAAGNSIEDIAALAEYAHRYWARVYVTLNTLLFDDELPSARRLAWQLHEAGVDGLIIQDVGLLEGELPPLPVIASTQMHNHTPERVAFLEQVGFRRAILARELDLAQIRAIHGAAPGIELEVFIHGALCVCYSGQCALSFALGGRSGNRGECAQPCRKAYDLVDASGQVLENQRHLLSVRDLSLSGRITELLAAGVCSFKIEGRLKDRAYVANVVAHYRDELDRAISAAGLRRASSGASQPGFTPDLSKTFNRGFTSYYLDGRVERIGSPETPKMTGEFIGRVRSIQGGSITLDAGPELRPGDGICFFDGQGRLQGSTVNAAAGRTVTPDRLEGIQPGAEIRRNHDHAFLAAVEAARPRRSIAVEFTLESGGLLRARDQDGVSVEQPLGAPAEPAQRPEQAAETIRRQLAKTGDTEFACAGVQVEAQPVPFLPVSALNAARREILACLRRQRAEQRPRMQPAPAAPNAVFPARELSYLGNVLNRDAEAFYRRHGVERIEPAAESGLDLHGRKLMTTRYCLRYEMDLCPREGSTARVSEPLTLIDEQGRRLELRFDCAACEMQVLLPG